MDPIDRDLDRLERARIQPQVPISDHLPVDIVGDADHQWARRLPETLAQRSAVKQPERQVDLAAGRALVV
jgi:hypothetical protein